MWSKCSILKCTTIGVTQQKLVRKEIDLKFRHCHLSSKTTRQCSAATSRKYAFPQATANIDKNYCILK